MKDFDAVVIGAGLGGLSAATSLAKAGKRVLVLEKHNVPGGYATSFLRGRFEFEVALHELSGLGSEDNQGPIWKILHQYGVYPRVEFLPIHEFFHSYFPDFEITIPVGREGFEKALCQKFPGQQESIMKMSATIFDFAEEALKANRVGMKAVMQDPSQFPTMMAHFGKTLDQVLGPIVPDEKVRAVFSQIWGYLCQPPASLSFFIYALLMTGYLKFGPSHIKGTSQALSQAFVDVIEESGGEVWLSNGASKILVSNSSVAGVVTEKGTRINTPYVICNANPISASMNLIGSDNLPAWYLKRLGAWTGGASTFNMYIGLDRPYTDMGFKSHENFINKGYDINKQFEMMMGSIPTETDGAAVTAYNTVDASFSPKGTTSVVITLIADSMPWLKLSGSEYFDAKNRVADSLIKLAEKIAPGLREHIEVVEVATPLTNMRFTGNVGGSIIGFHQNYQGTGLSHLPNRGPLDGLYFAGAWVNIGGGFETCMESGFFAARDVLKDMSRGGRDPAVNEKMKTQLEKEAGDAASATNLTTAVHDKVLAKIHSERKTLRVVDVIKETASTHTLRMEAVDGQLPSFRPGQYINLVVRAGGTLTSRPYSISSMPSNPYYDLTVRHVPDGFISHFLLSKVRKGDTFEFSGPHGHFYHEPLFDSNDLVLLAGGSGITPFMSIVRDAVDKTKKVNIHLLYGSRDPQDIIFKDELDAIAGSNSNIKVDFVISEPPPGWKGECGLLDATMIKKLIKSTDDRTFLMCGPAQMYELCESALLSLGVPARRIRKEVYGPPADVTAESGWPSGISASASFNITEKRTGLAFSASAREPLLVAMEKAGVVVPAVCRSGECTACRTKLLTGTVFMPPRMRRRWIDEKGNYIHPCMSYPLEDLTIRV